MTIGSEQLYQDLGPTVLAFTKLQYHLHNRLHR